MKKIPLIFGVICFLLTIAICIQMQTVENITNEVGVKIYDNSELKDEVLSLQEKYKNAYKELEDTEALLEQTRLQSTTNNEEDSKVEISIKENNKLLGLTSVTGGGIIINLDDNRDVNSSEVLDINSYLVHETDLVQIVNELFNAGADAVSINGQRIVSTTAILCDGNIIRINGEMIGTPIEIKAIGYPERLHPALARPQGYLQLMANDGVKVKITKTDNAFTIPKYEGIYSYEYINRGE